MSDFKSSKVDKLYNLLKKKVERFRISVIKPNETEIMKFCELINENNLIFLDNSAAIKAGFEGKLVHPGYLMSLTNPIVQLILIKEGADLFLNLAKAFIHAGSEVEFFKPLLMNKNYKIKVDLSEPIEKKGKKANYCSIILKLSVLDENNDIYAIDNHICFFRF